MWRYTLITIYFLISIGTTSYSQRTETLKEVEHAADSLYGIKNYEDATALYSKALSLTDFDISKANLYYNIACCLSLQNKRDSAFLNLHKSIASGYSDKAHIEEDTDLIPLHNDIRWNALLETIKPEKKVLNADPDKVKFVTDDIKNFWVAYDTAQQDTIHYKALFKKYYFDKGTRGMKDYMGLKVNTIDFFISTLKTAPEFYSAIRKYTLQIDGDKKRFLTDFKKLKALYPDALFPDVYFVIGAFTSGGTVSDAGLLIGVNQMCEAPGVPMNELDFRIRTRVQNIQYLPNIIAHELIHLQQGGLKNDTTTLSYVIREGMADFIGGLISGKSANERLFHWTKGKEKKIWGNFKQDMYYNRYNNWIANSKNATPDNLPDQGYWIGFQICKAYYDNAPDKNAAIYAMLHIQDYKKFLEKSGWGSIIEKM